MPNHLHLAQSEQDYATAKILFLEYAAWLNVDLCFQSFEQELADITVQYAPPKGGIFLLEVGGEKVGCVGVRQLKKDVSGRVCELKRMYIRAAFRGKGYGKDLLEAAENLAKSLGYTAMWLDTLDRLEAAVALYRQSGFEETAPYYDNPLPTVRYFEKKLI
jgi:GNAT superfamily N-acetyltransferase